LIQLSLINDIICVYRIRKTLLLYIACHIPESKIENIKKIFLNLDKNLDG